ncbi:uncharacterized protein LOC113310532 [Papaver somniferum]|uniref:uncharacterized protein LOC113310532 n=1 Tax=Papaver somniferum TaxID=3469 RepID=UPI000E6F81C7|nr:uncharacterized protein LOC113310532 [Papaver somniferum]
MIKLFARKCIGELHNTKYKLSLHNDTIDTHCAICGRGEETIKHLIFSCDHARKVRRLVNVGIDEVQRRYNSVSEWFESWFIGSNQCSIEKWLYTLMISAWIIWKDKCDVTFQGVSLNTFNSMHKIHYHLHSHLHESCINNNNLNVIMISQWKPPLSDIFKFNVHASFSQETNMLGTGIVIRSNTGNFEGMESKEPLHMEFCVLKQENAWP